MINLIPPPQLCRGVCWLLLMSLSIAGLTGYLCLPLLPSYLSPPTDTSKTPSDATPTHRPLSSLSCYIVSNLIKNPIQYNMEVVWGDISWGFWLGYSATSLSYLRLFRQNPALSFVMIFVTGVGSGGGRVKEDNEYDLNPFYTTVTSTTTP